MSETQTEAAMRWGRPAWELVGLARTRAMADRLQQEALDRAEAAGIAPQNRTSFAFGWLAGEAARRIVRLEEDAARARHAADPATPPTPRQPEGVAGTPPSEYE